MEKIEELIRRNGEMADTRHLECRAMSVRVQVPLPLPVEYAGCHADRDGDCVWKECPQLRDGEPERSGRHCPRDNWKDEEF